MGFLKSPLGAALAVFLTLFVGSSALLNRVIPTTCRDGWHSPSIGRRGACSWHGGVTDHGKGVMTLLISGVGAFSVYAWRGSRIQPPRTSSSALPNSTLGAQPQIPLPLQVPDKIHGCPKCGAPMRKRLAKRGKFRGREFMGCSRYPRCDGIRALDDAEDAPTAPNT